MPLRIRSLVGLIPLIAVEVLESEVIDSLPGFQKRMNWFLENRKDLAHVITCMKTLESEQTHHHRLLAIPSRERLVRTLHYLLDTREFLSDYGIRSLSQIHRNDPYIFQLDSHEYRVEYVPGESDSGLFGGNSNWRGPIWFPINYLILEALERYHHFYGDSLKVECPTGSDQWMNLAEVAKEISARLVKLFLPDKNGYRPCHGEVSKYAQNPHWRNLVLFHEYFHGDNGKGLGASHQTGWTALVLRHIKDLAKRK